MGAAMMKHRLHAWVICVLVLAAPVAARANSFVPGTDPVVQTNTANTASGVGTPGDTSWTGTGSSSVIGVLKAIFTKLLGVLTVQDTASETSVATIATNTTRPSIAPVASTASEAAHVFKGSAGTLYGLSVTAGGVSGYVMLFNATAAPADGAVTPLKCVPLAAGQSAGLSHDPGTNGWSFPTGITAVFSTTGCFTTSASSTAFFSAQVQ